MPRERLELSRACARRILRRIDGARPISGRLLSPRIWRVARNPEKRGDGCGGRRPGPFLPLAAEGSKKDDAVLPCGRREDAGGQATSSKGQFEDWVERNFGLRTTQAQLYMKLANDTRMNKTVATRAT